MFAIRVHCAMLMIDVNTSTYEVRAKHQSVTEISSIMDTDGTNWVLAASELCVRFQVGRVRARC
jgi:hypothetical protein